MEDTRDHVLMYVLEKAGILSVDSSIEVIGYWSCGALIEGLVFEIPSRLRVVGESAFRNGLFTLVTFPASLLMIGRRAFWEARIQEVKFEQDSKLERIKREAFHESQLKRMMIPRTVTHIGRYAFSCCYFAEIQLEKKGRLRRIPSRAREHRPTGGACNIS
jgi:hypothetical protein